MILENPVVMVSGMPHPGITRGTLTYSADNVERQATIEADEPRGAPFIFRLRSEVVIMAGADVLLTGYVQRLARRVSKGQRTVSATIKSKSARTAKTAAQAAGHSLKKKTVGDAAKELFKGVKVDVHDESGGGKAFDWKWTPGDTAFDVVEKQARASGHLLMGHKDGGVIIAKGVRGQHAGVLAIPGEIHEGTSDLSDEGEYSKTIALGQTRDGVKKQNLRPKAEAKNDRVDDGTVQILLNETEFDAEDLKTRAKARRNRRQGSNISCTLPLLRWRDDAGKIWEPAYTIHVSALEDLEIDQPMGIKSVTLAWAKAGTSGDAQSAELNMVDPPALNGKAGKSKSAKEHTADDSDAKYEDED